MVVHGVFVYSNKMVIVAQALEDKDIFPTPQYVRPPTFTIRNTVKAIVLNTEGKVGLVTNDVHTLCLLPGGGAEHDDLKEEVRRECIEELRCDVRGITVLGLINEYRYRDAEEYHTTCFVAEAFAVSDTEDRRTANERKHNLHPVWVSTSEAQTILEEQSERAKNGTIPYYNSAFNAVRDHLFFNEYLRLLDEQERIAV